MCDADCTLRPPPFRPPAPTPVIAPTAQFLQHYQVLFNKPGYVRALAQGATFLAASLIAIFAAVTFATTNASNHVTDILLGNVGPHNVRFLFVYGTFTEFLVTGALVAVASEPTAVRPEASALFLLGARGVRVADPHRALADRSAAAAPFLNSIFYGGDLFFSGHTGLPFLAALVFWHIPALPLFYLAPRCSSARSCSSAIITIRFMSSPRCSSPMASSRSRAGRLARFRVVPLVRAGDKRQPKKANPTTRSPDGPAASEAAPTLVPVVGPYYCHRPIFIANVPGLCSRSRASNVDGGGVTTRWRAEPRA